MLRLRPSELTLTPEDVQDTFRRLAQKQAARASAAEESRGSARPGRPVISRGPQRSTRDAITVFGVASLPELQPQHATTITVAGEVEDVGEPEPPCSQDARRDSLIADGTAVPTQRLEHPASSSGLRHLQLPFRPEPGHTHHVRHVTSNPGEPASIPTTQDPSQRAAIRNTHGVRESASSRPVTPPTNNHADLRGGAGGENSGRTHTHMDDRAAGQTPSPLRLAQRLASPLPSDCSPDPVKTSVPPPRTQPIRHLEGYFKSPHGKPKGFTYHFHESVMYPQSEPRRVRGRAAMPTRSLSSGSAPPFSHLALRPDPADSSDEAEFFDAIQDSRVTDDPAFTRFLSTLRSSHAGPSSTVRSISTMTGSRQRQRMSSSGASNASAAFSYHGSLPSESRHSSSGMSGMEQLSHSQHDGAAASTEIGSGIYHKVRSGYSPLPSSPYTRFQGSRITSQPCAALRRTTSGDDYPTATEAAARDLRSPLDDYSEQYQRMSRYQSSGEAMLIYPPQLPSTGLNRDPSRRGSGGNAYRNPYASLTMRDYQARPPPGAQLSQQPNRSQHATRANQRSMRTTQASAVGPIRSGLPITISPGDVSNRDRIQGSRQMAPRPAAHHQEGPFLSSSPPPIPRIQHRPQAPTLGTGFGSILSMPAPPGYGSAPQYYTGPQRSQTRTQRQVSTTAAPSLHLQPTRDSPSTSLALDHGSGITSRRSRSPLVRAMTTARTHRRVPAHQRDQENSAEAEFSAMRREEAAVHARYGENEQQETMNETPPRVGRFERAMFE
ncbi:hypothetical protein T440DRAFT_479738 [Plenodomus tracheiphilus IPT5]|uniref:Uncharacterized protein n=1 Tax=Plenodomus tracheiphilus IPT5 TaxID=1408161 RepID=A0A6A7B3I3_9PLEO|nr:hypothetical protein T440DRAFT_479738 [Plenodomus tracheiphilus IPT5]